MVSFTKNHEFFINFFFWKILYSASLQLFFQTETERQRERKKETESKRRRDFVSDSHRLYSMNFECDRDRERNLFSILNFSEGEERKWVKEEKERDWGRKKGNGSIYCTWKIISETEQMHFLRNVFLSFLLSFSFFSLVLIRKKGTFINHSLFHIWII